MIEVDCPQKTDLPKLSNPAQRALAGAGITRLVQLTSMTEKELLQLHGVGSSTIKALWPALQEQGLSFLSEEN